MITPYGWNFDLTIPIDYNHDSQFDDSYRAMIGFISKEDERYLIPPPRDLPERHFTNERFGRVTHRLIPGKTYKVRTFEITSGDEVNGDWVSTEDCLNFLKKRKAYLVGAHGLTIIQQLLPRCVLGARGFSGRFTGAMFSFDEPALLPTIPMIFGTHGDQKERNWERGLHSSSDRSGDFEDLFVDSNKFISFED